MMNKLSILVMVVFGSLLISTGYDHNKAYAQSIPEIQGLNQTISSLDGFLHTPRTSGVFYPVFFMILLLFFMLCAFRLRFESYAFVFSVAATIMCILLGLIFLAPIDFVYTEKKTETVAEQIQWLNDINITNNTSVLRTHTESLTIPNEPSFKLIISTLFLVLTLFNGFYAIMILTKQIGNFR